VDLVRKSLLRIWTWPMSTWNVSFEIPWSISFCRRLHSSTRKAWRANASCRYSHQSLGTFEAHEAGLQTFLNICLHNGDRRLSHYPRYRRICMASCYRNILCTCVCCNVRQHIHFFLSLVLFINCFCVWYPSTRAISLEQVLPPCYRILLWRWFWSTKNSEKEKEKRKGNKKVCGANMAHRHLYIGLVFSSRFID
jgi:hypothetical protein